MKASLCHRAIGIFALAFALPCASAFAQATSAEPAPAASTDGIATPPVARAPLPAEVIELRNKDTRVLTIGYRLVTGNARYCETKTYAAGLLLHDVGAYGDSDGLRKTLGLQGDVGVQALVPGGPAQQAGLHVDDTVIAIGDLSIADIPNENAKRWERIETIRAETERLLSETGTLPLTVLREGAPVVVTIEGVPACPSRFEVGLGKRAVADGHRVVIGPEFVGIDYPEALLAGIVAHEFAHNMLRHRAWFDAYGKRTGKGVRLTEREADRLSPWLLANAGLDPRGGVEFFKKWGPRHGMWIFRDRSHDAWDERAENMAAELPQIELLMESEGGADWSRHFHREKLPSR